MYKPEFEIIKTFDGDIIKITCDGEITHSGFECLPDSRYMNCYDDYGEYYTEHEQILFDMCNCFGASEEEIMLMFDYGYTVNDIENMLMCPDMIEEIIHEIKSEDEVSLCEECIV